MGGGCPAHSVVVLGKVEGATLVSVCVTHALGEVPLSPSPSSLAWSEQKQMSRSGSILEGPRMAQRSSGVQGTRSGDCGHGACGPVAGGPPPVVLPLVPVPVMVSFQPRSRASVPWAQRLTGPLLGEGRRAPSGLVLCGFGALSFPVGTTRRRRRLTRSAFGPGEV